MSITDLQEWLLDNSAFQILYNKLLIDSVSDQFPNLKRTNKDANIEHNWKYMLLCASLLAQSENGGCQDVALRIAQYCMEIECTTDEERVAAAVILDSLANHPAIELAETRRFLRSDYIDILPFTLFQDWTRRSINHSIPLCNNRSLQANRFQCKFWKSVKEYDWVSLSAPTSAGKSFIIGQWLVEYLFNNLTATIVYIVPTRALIQQVQRDIDELIKSESFENIAVATLPLKSSFFAGRANIFVFTQERFHILLASLNNEINVDLLIIDEAQKIGDNNRGVLLQQAIEAISQKDHKTNIIFASPMTINPEVLLDEKTDGVLKIPITSEDTMVNQNLIWVSQFPRKPCFWNVELIVKGEPKKIGIIELQNSPTLTSKRLPFIAFALGDYSGGNVIYANGASDAETAAKQIYDLIGDTNTSSDHNEINDLIKLIQKTIHRNYSLVKVLRRGVAFHYGNMPLLVRTEIERLFRLNIVKYLVCTSTLIEGINMPCKSIFARGPTKGRGKPMSQSDFWNLAGRAGRWGQEFQGNIVCVDARRADVWKKGPPREREKFKITRTADDVLMGNGELLLDFIDSKTPRSIASENPDLEHVFSYIITSYIRNKGSMPPTWKDRFGNKFTRHLDEIIQNVLKTLKTPHEVILRNPGISPIAMDGLLSYFKDRTCTKRKPIEELIPVYAESDDAYQIYLTILHRINKHLGNDAFGRGGRVNMLAMLIVNWMRGHSLARMIKSREDYYHNKPNFKLSTTIRNTMEDVEKYARFQAPKYLGCYVDLLKSYLEKTGQIELFRGLFNFDINVMLEFGVSQTTQLSLIGLGISRTSAIEISEFITNNSLTESECLDWLKENDWMVLDMPEIVKKEVGLILKDDKKH